jgi:choline dehydrogenase
VQYVVEKDGNLETHDVYGKEIILCAGAVNSPAILERSGIGDPAVLGPLGIDVLVNNPNVGNNMVNQYGTTVIVGVPTSQFANQCFWNLAQNNTKPAFDPAYQYPDDNTRRVQIDQLQAGPSAGICQTFILEPQSVGSTHIVSRNPLVLSLIDLNMYSDGSYLTNGTDANKIVTAVNLIASGVGVGNMFQPPGSLFSNPPGTDPASDAALFEFITSPDALQIEDHIIATTRMGTSINNGVVDGNLNVFGVQNLKIADIGVLPVVPNGNTGYAAYVVGLRAATILGAPVPPAL